MRHVKVFVVVIPKNFFWYDNDKDLKVCFLVMRVIKDLSCWCYVSNDRI